MVSKYDKPMMATAIIWSNESKCTRLKVGCVISTKDGRIVTNGYNGTISGQSNECEEYVVKCNSCKSTHNIPNNIDNYSIHNLYRFECECGTTNYLTKEQLLEKRYLKTNDFTLHAEQNAITNAAKLGIPLEGTTMYITHSPCKNCAKLIAQSGIKRVVYNDEYKDSSGIEFLIGLGISVSRHVI